MLLRVPLQTLALRGPPAERPPWASTGVQQMLLAAMCAGH